jgi:hypothetical protein
LRNPDIGYVLGMARHEHDEQAEERHEREADDVANDELPLDPAGPTEFGEAVDT